jgi:hypothetical protein
VGTRVRRTVVALAATLVAGQTLASCTSASPTDAGATSTQPTQATQATPTKKHRERDRDRGRAASAAPATTAPPVVPSAPASLPSTPPVAVEAAPEACRADDLGRVSQVERVLDGSDPLMATDVTVANVSREACFLSGWAGVTLIGDGIQPVQVTGQAAPPEPDHDVAPRQRVERLPGDAPPITLAPGGSTSFSVLYDGITCLHPVWRMDLQVPGDARPIEVARTSICNSDPVQVGPFGSVVGG